VDVPVSGSPALLLRFGTPCRLVCGVVSAPDMEVRQDSAGVLLAAAEHADGASEDEARRAAGRTLAAIRRRLRGGSGATFGGAVVGVRPMPRDGLPIVGFARGAENLYLATMHSGVTMAAVVGRLAACEILDGSPSPLLGFCRLERFAGPSAR
jgi:glycine/D-amino acid oxidase-like deaminating enzyme